MRAEDLPRAVQKMKSGCNTIAFYLTKYVLYVMNLFYMYIFLTVEQANLIYLSQFVIFVLGVILAFNTQSNKLSTWL